MDEARVGLADGSCGFEARARVGRSAVDTCDVGPNLLSGDHRAPLCGLHSGVRVKLLLEECIQVGPVQRRRIVEYDREREERDVFQDLVQHSLKGRLLFEGSRQTEASARLADSTRSGRVSDERLDCNVFLDVAVDEQPLYGHWLRRGYTTSEFMNCYVHVLEDCVV